MIPTEFDYHRAASVDEALDLLSRHGDDAKLFAGGHSLLPAMKLRLSSPTVIIDISRLEDLKGIGEEDDHVVIGGGATGAACQNGGTTTGTIAAADCGCACTTRSGASAS